MRLLLASNNAKKRRELEHILAHFGVADVEVVTPADVGGIDILRNTLGYVPRLQIEITKGEVTDVDRSPNESSWKGIPVPVY